MLYTSTEDFYNKAATIKRLSLEEEKELARKMKDGDEDAYKTLRDSYLPVLGSYLKRYTHTPSLSMIYRGITVLNESISTFDFQFDSPSPNCVFVHVLSDRIRRMMVQYIADNPTQ